MVCLQRNKKLELINDIYGIAYNCPYGERLCNCPFKKSSLNNFYEKVEFLRDCSNKKIIQIFQHHTSCSDRRNLEHLKNNN